RVPQLLLVAARAIGRRTDHVPQRSGPVHHREGDRAGRVTDFERAVDVEADEDHRYPDVTVFPSPRRGPKRATNKRSCHNSGVGAMPDKPALVYPPTVWALIERAAVDYADEVLLADESSRSLSFPAYRDACIATAGALSALGIAPGTPVSWQLPTTI